MRRICTDRKIEEIFSDVEPLSLEQIQGRLNVSKVVAYREIKRANALRAINNTGWYILPGERRFGRNGFLKIQDKVFFSGGGLSDALIHLVLKSHSGMNLNELRRVVCVSADVQLLNLVEKNILHRHKFGGHYYYFSADGETRARQLEVRERQFAKPDRRLILERAETIPLELVIKVLVTFIENPDFSPKSIALSLVRRGEKVRTQMVKSVFVKYDLCKKNF